MNSKILSLLLLLIVAIGFSGVASAATMQKLISAEIPAWDEITPAKDAWNETISEAKAAYDEQVPYRDLYIVQGPNDLQDWYDFIYSHEGAIGGYGRWDYYPEVSHIEQGIDVPEHIETVVDVPEHYESRLVSEAYDEEVSVEANHYGAYLNPSATQIKGTPDHHNYNANKYPLGTVKYGFKVVDDTGCGNNKMWTPVFIVKVIHHDAVYEDVLIPATYKDIIVPATYKDVKVVDEVAHYLVRGAYTIHHPAVDAVIVEHPAVDAVYVHHPAIPAVFETIEVPEPIVKEDKTIDIPVTGGSFNFLILALISVFGGMAIAYKLRK